MAKHRELVQHEQDRHRRHGLFLLHGIECQINEQAKPAAAPPHSVSREAKINREPVLGCFELSEIDIMARENITKGRNRHEVEIASRRRQYRTSLLGRPIEKVGGGILHESVERRVAQHLLTQCVESNNIGGIVVVI